MGTTKRWRLFHFHRNGVIVTAVFDLTLICWLDDTGSWGLSAVHGVYCKDNPRGQELDPGWRAALGGNDPSTGAGDRHCQCKPGHGRICRWWKCKVNRDKLEIGKIKPQLKSSCFFLNSLSWIRPPRQQRSARTSPFCTIRWQLESYRTLSASMYVSLYFVPSCVTSWTK